MERALAPILIALRAVLRNKLRAALTIVGITIGIAAVVTVTALGQSARANVDEQISNLGSNALIVFPRSARASGLRSSASNTRLKESDAAALVRDSTSIRAAVGFMRASGQVVYEAQNATASIIGTRLDYFTIRSWHVVKGEAWTETSEAVSERVVVLGQQTAHDLFGKADPIGHTVRIGQHPYVVVGLLEEKGESPFGQNQDEVVLMPITTLRSHILSTPFRDDVHALLMSATTSDTTDRAKDQAEEILRQRHHIRPGDEDNFIVRSQAEFQAMRDAVIEALSALLVSVAAISLVVGGIGVMNIMLVSVTERTREIGIRMAIGAREFDIMGQFLLEALVLATLGGIAGTIIGYSGIVALGLALDWHMKLDVRSLATALGVSTSIGLVFGFFPARRAARLDPVVALGRE